MTARTGRGTTGVGRVAILPVGGYQPEVEVPATSNGFAVDFHGEDGRHRAYPIGQLPLAVWHEPLAAAFDTRVGPTGSRRTATSADGLWETLGRFMRFLAALPQPPAEPAVLTPGQVEAFLREREEKVGAHCAWRELREVGQVLQATPMGDHLSPAVLDLLRQRRPQRARRGTPKPGYSDSELGRLVAAARSDVAGIRDRIQTGEALLTRYGDNPDSLSATDRRDAAILAQMAASGVVPEVATRSGFHQANAGRRRLARQLFLTLQDLAPLMVLLVAVTGRNSETIKELPAEHRLLDGRAVELRLVKRRRGPRCWFDTVTWEIGPPHRELHTPGGLYLLLHRLTSRGRSFHNQPQAIWSAWRVGTRAGVCGSAEHHNPFARLDVNLYCDRWAQRHSLTADPRHSLGQEHASEGIGAPPLPVDLNRLKTSIEVRHTKQMGGHLPSAARTNTIPVLFTNYLRGDPTTIDWAHEIVSAALVDAEQAALASHHRTLTTAGGSLRVVPGPVDTERLGREGLDANIGRRALAGELDTAWSACIDHNQHPRTGQPCRSSFLDCFHCGNCLITREHLPRLLGLLDALALRRQQLTDTDWWARYGPAWVAIRHDVLTKFSPAELDDAARTRPTNALLDLVEHPWRRP